MNRSFLVAGAGRSGVAAVNLLLRKGEAVCFYDGNASLNREELQKKLLRPVEVYLNELPDPEALGLTDAVLSPGIPVDAPFVCALKEKGVRILSEIELAYLFEQGTVIGITGTNGKTTTTTLVSEIMKAYKGAGKAFVAGNIGIPYADEADRTAPDSVTTLELSSFQLETIDTFHAKISAILNITPDHLNRHHTMEAYAEAKYRIAENETAGDTLILNENDERLREFGARPHQAKVVWFSGVRTLTDGYFLRGDELIRSANGAETVLLRTDETTLVGQCNYENILAAFAIADAAGVPEELTKSVIRAFRAVAHRIEYTATVNGVRYYDDSKGTNPDAAIQGIRAMTSKTVLIGGGYDKGSEFDEWIDAFGGKVKLLILMGVTAEKIAETAKRHGFTEIAFVVSMEEAVRLAAKTPLPGEAVLLSPACASWGMFKDYEERGDIFKALVRKMEEQ
ncbi:MAG: UDP-N-acetylmuramoyl-L-alanine--D-glutamate ligase [Lachnospiraceae bacterium]|nr:UDP-N-acetylmuramoyl-L-alanine--D-glutamate ligase [Lachnospiraceae bacterium]